jgi:hypothetical protein
MQNCREIRLVYFIKGKLSRDFEFCFWYQEHVRMLLYFVVVAIFRFLCHSVPVASLLCELIWAI